jgi:hypothetical protein
MFTFEHFFPPVLVQREEGPYILDNTGWLKYWERKKREEDPSGDFYQLCCEMQMNTFIAHEI